MAEEYGWSSARKASEISNAVVFLTSMGLPASAAPGAAAAAEPKLNTLMGRVEHALYTGLGLRSGSSAGSGVKVVTSSSGRSMIDAAEMESLKAAFRRESSGTSGERLPRVSVLGLVKSIPGFEGVSNKEYDYVLVETGLKSRDDVDMNEFVEVCALYLCWIVVLIFHPFSDMRRTEGSLNCPDTAVGVEGTKEAHPCREEWWGNMIH
jgi:glycerol-3-phosphate dehydrogenase